MLKVRQAQKAGHDLYPDNSQMTREEGAVACGLKEAQFGAQSGCRFAAGSEGCSASCPGTCQVGTAVFHHHPASPIAALVLFISTLFPCSDRAFLWVQCLCLLIQSLTQCKDHKKLFSKTRPPRPSGKPIQTAKWLSHFM